MLSPSRLSESQALAAYVDEQAGALRAAAHGLTEEEGRRTPCRSALSVGGLIKHATMVLAAVPREGDELTPAEFARFTDSFALRDDETLEAAIDEFDRVRRTAVDRIAGEDADSDIEVPSAPWHGRHESTAASARFQSLHLVEELARHAGHADIIREEIDGAGAGPLMLAEEGRPGNGFMQPWVRDTGAA